MIVLLYMLKLTLCSGLFFGYYLIMLRNKPFHQYNRYYILATVVLPVVLPLISIPIAFVAQPSNGSLIKTLNVISMGGLEDEFIITAQTTFLRSLLTMQNVFLCIYVTGFIIFIAPVIKSLLFITNINSKHALRFIDGVAFYNTAEPGAPFSYFNAIYWNRSISLNSEEGRYILRHELFHIHEKHSYDIVFMQCITGLCWFNPFYHLMKMELQTIHEFLADRYATGQSDRRRYAELLVLHAMQKKQITTVNQFFNNQTKRRITMLTTNTNRYNYLGKIMALPLLFVIFCAFTLNVQQRSDAAMLQKTVQTDTIPATTLAKMNPGDTVRVDVNKNAAVFKLRNGDSIITSLKELTALNKKNKDERSSDQSPVFTKLEVEAAYPGGHEGWSAYLNKSLQYPGEAAAKKIEGTVIVQFVVDKAGDIGNVEAISGPNDGGLREEAIRVVKNSGKWIPGKQNGLTVKSYRKQPLTFKLSDKSL